MNPFEYKEILDNNLFNEHSRILYITKDCTPKILLLRSIIGTIGIKHIHTQTEFVQTIDYLDLGNKNPLTNPLEKIKGYIFDDLSFEEFSVYFSNKNFLYQNFEFFKQLNLEFNNFFYYENKKSHTTAFVYIYRILEIISYAFPLIYASKTTDFKGTYTFLKSCLSVNSEKDKGELGFFKSFIKVVFKEDPLFESSITINVNGDTEDIQEIFFNAFKKSCSINIFDSNDTEEPRKIAVKFSEYSSFIINLRNRFFHLFNSGQPNLQSDEIIDSDYFFSLVNKQSMSWLSLVLLEVLKFTLEKNSLGKISNCN